MSIVIPSPLGARDKRFIENYWKFVEKFRITLLLRRADHAGAARQERAAAARTSARCATMPCTGSTAFPAEVARQIEKL